MTQYTIAKDVGPDDWSALPRAFKRGETIHRYSGHDYGCARDDAVYAKRHTISCSETGGAPFFTVPVEFLVTKDGKQPLGDYCFAE